nr:FAD-dependent oxidoreductase [Serratia liquefaciens]
MHDVIIIGAGLVGLGVANALQETNSMLRILILEKENGPAAHQSGHNSNVVHSGIYYTPGSLKARLAKLGNQSMFAFCREHDLYQDQCGKMRQSDCGHPIEGAGFTGEYLPARATERAGGQPIVAGAVKGT